MLQNDSSHGLSSQTLLRSSDKKRLLTLAAWADGDTSLADSIMYEGKIATSDFKSVIPSCEGVSDIALRAMLDASTAGLSIADCEDTLRSAEEKILDLLSQISCTCMAGDGLNNPLLQSLVQQLAGLHLLKSNVNQCSQVLPYGILAFGEGCLETERFNPWQSPNATSRVYNRSRTDVLDVEMDVKCIAHLLSYARDLPAAPAMRLTGLATQAALQAGQMSLAAHCAADIKRDIDAVLPELTFPEVGHLKMLVCMAEAQQAQQAVDWLPILSSFVDDINLPEAGQQGSKEESSTVQFLVSHMLKEQQTVDVLQASMRAVPHNAGLWWQYAQHCYNSVRTDRQSKNAAGMFLFILL